MNEMSNTTIDILTHYGFRVAVIYTAGGITVNITKDGRGQECSGLDVDNTLELMLARLIDAGAIPIEAASSREVRSAGQEVAVNQTTQDLRSPETEGLQQEQRGGNIELDGEGQTRKAKKVK